ncbi:MAG: LppX_LprAFG lipoprotein [Chloroflexi bacterium]|nr:LppX_LprAFG lipoprotein [Chloroflexota bacterium]
MKPNSSTRRALRFLLIATAAWLAACSLATPPAPPPRDLVNQAAQKFSAIQSLHFSIEFSGDPTYLDRAHTLALRRVEGDVVRPDRMRASVKAALPGAYVLINAIGIGEHQFATNPLNGKWEKIPTEWGFNPAILFQSSTGLGALMTQAQNLTALADEHIENQRYHRLRGDIAGTAVAPITGWLIGDGTIQVELWIGANDAPLRRIRLTEILPNATPSPGTPVPPTQWLIDLTKFDVPVEINQPEIGSK